MVTELPDEAVFTGAVEGWGNGWVELVTFAVEAVMVPADLLEGAENPSIHKKETKEPWVSHHS